MAKLKQLIIAVTTTLTLSASTAYALNLEDITWSSKVGQPLSAKIQLSDLQGLPASDIKATLASPTAFSNAGIDRSTILNSLIFTPQADNQGNAYIKVSSSQPIKEPYLNFIIDVSWGTNKISKEYTILMDAPDNETNITPNNTKQTQIVTPTTATTKTPSSTTTQPTSPMRTYKIVRGDTLWTIAKKFRGNAKSVSQVEQLIYKANPKAFINGNTAHLREGYVLSIPSTSKNTTSAPQTNQIQAKLEAAKQLLNTALQEHGTLNTEVDQLQNEIKKLNALAQEKNEQITELQKKLGTTPTNELTAENQTPTNPITDNTNTASQQPQTNAITTNDKTAVPPTPVTNEATTPQTNADSNNIATANTTTPQTENQPQQPTTPATNNTQTTTAQPPTTPVTNNKPTQQPTPPKIITPPIRKPVANNSFLPFLPLDNTMLMALGGGTLIIVCLAIIVIRRRRAAKDDLTEVDLSHIMLDNDDNDNQHTEPALTAVHSEDEHEHEDDESLLDKADILLSYKQASDAKKLLLHAVETAPTNTDYHLKLLEAYAELEDKEAFDDEENTLLRIDPTTQQKIDNLKKRYPTLFNESNKAPVTDTEISQPSIHEADIHTESLPTDDFSTLYDDTHTSLDDHSLDNALATPSHNDNDTSWLESTELEPDQQHDLHSLDAQTTTLDDDYLNILNNDTLSEHQTDIDLTENDIIDTSSLLPETQTHTDQEPELLLEDLDHQSTLDQDTLEDQNNTSNLDSSNGLDLGFDLPTEDEITTKLELAKAYIETGDHLGAQDILEEVIKEGNDEQKESAQQLLDSIK